LSTFKQRLIAVEREILRAQRNIKNPVELTACLLNLCRAHAKASAILARRHNFIAQLEYSKLRLESVFSALNEVIKLWTDVREYLRYAPRTANSLLPSVERGLDQLQSTLAQARRGLHDDVEEAADRERGTGQEINTGETNSSNNKVSNLDKHIQPLQQSQQNMQGGSPSRLENSLADFVASPESGNASTNTEILIPPNLDEEIPYLQLTSPEYLRTREFRVWYGTNRARSDQFPGGFGRDSGPLHFGVCKVYVPKSHEFASFGSCWLTRFVRAKFRRKEDDRLRLLSTAVFSPEEFAAELALDYKRWPKRTALVIIHGYNVDFAEAARRTAQIGFDLRIDGITAFYSWPSRGRVLPYTFDEESVQIAEHSFLRFLRTLADVEGIEEINLLAHSMGNRLLLRSIPEIARTLNTNKPIPIGQIILAAADVPVEQFRGYVQHYRAVARKRLTSYSCDKDVPLRASRKLHGQQRLGLEPPLSVFPGVDAVSAAELDIHGLGHGYYAETEALLYDLSQLLQGNVAPGWRTRLEPGPPESGEHWIFKK
jgi:esterase/lipase superfamily enzyme